MDGYMKQHDRNIQKGIKAAHKWSNSIILIIDDKEVKSWLQINPKPK